MQGAYCNGCGRRVQLNNAGECPQGHLRSMLRDVRQGVEAEPVRPARASDTRRKAGAPIEQPPSHELLSAIIGKAFVIVPVAAIVAFGLWTGYEQGIGSGMSAGAAGLMSVGSLVITVGLAFAWAAFRRKRR